MSTCKIHKYSVVGIVTRKEQVGINGVAVWAELSNLAKALNESLMLDTDLERQQRDYLMNSRKFSVLSFRLVTDFLRVLP